MMRIIISVALLTIVCSFGSYASSTRAPTYKRLSSHTKDRMRRIIESEGGCNANVCFALDGSRSLSSAEFEAQKIFVLDVVSIISVDNEVELAAVQYGRRRRPISRLTFDTDSFILAVDRARSLRSKHKSIGAGIMFCAGQLRRRRHEANKIVVLGDGRTSFADNPGPIADHFRRTGGDICAVGVGYRDPQSLLDVVGGDSSKMLTVDDFFELADIIDSLVEQVCGMPEGTLEFVAPS